MNKSVTIDLISKTYTTDSMGQRKAVEKSTAFFYFLRILSRYLVVPTLLAQIRGLFSSNLRQRGQGDRCVAFLR
jgi:hypothetical protein